jgi:catechol 2,3-dioxygenase-like lactoylglutathione lyase family enzyme
MKMIPLFRCRNMQAAIAFYTGILDFELKEPGASVDDWVVLLKNGSAGSKFMKKPKSTQKDI